MIFSKMLHEATKNELIKGDLSGTCRICGMETVHGNTKKFGNSFTCADYISTGDVICPYCMYLVENSDNLRRTMYLLTENEFKKFKKKDIKDIVFNLPDEPFYLYLTKTWQKLGYIRMNEAYNKDNKGLIKIVLDYDIITCTIKELHELYIFVQSLRELKINKKTLESGHIEVYQFKRILEKYNEEARNVIKRIQDNTGNPVWDLAIYISD